MTVKTINVQTGDSPKIYARLADIYGEPFELQREEFDSLSYSVYRVAGGALYPLDGFTNVDDGLVWYDEAQDFPENVLGITEADREGGYNLVVYPYVAVDEVWTSPFSERNTTYMLVVKATYFMADDALDGAARHTRELKIRVVTGND